MAQEKTHSTNKTTITVKPIVQSKTGQFAMVSARDVKSMEDKVNKESLLPSEYEKYITQLNKQINSNKPVYAKYRRSFWEKVKDYLKDLFS